MSYKTVEAMLLELQQDKASVHIMLRGYAGPWIRIEVSGDNKFEFTISDDNLSLHETVTKAYDRYMKITNAVPEFVSHRLPPPTPVEQPASVHDNVQDASYKELNDDIPF